MILKVFKVVFILGIIATVILLVLQSIGIQYELSGWFGITILITAIMGYIIYGYRWSKPEY